MKILYVLSYLSKNGGVQSVVNNYTSQLMKYKDITIDFLTLLPNDEEMVKSIELLGGHVYQIAGSREKKLSLFIKEIKSFFKNHHDYDIIHSHQTNLDLFYLKEAKKWNIPVRIMHAHNTNCDISKIRMEVIKLSSRIYANYYFACSSESGKWMYGNKIAGGNRFYVVNNAILFDKYAYNEATREKYRSINKLDKNFVIGNVSRMTSTKNHSFLIDVFYEIKKMDQSAKLFLVGDGPLKEELIEKVKRLEMQDDVVFYGLSNEVNNLLQMMDVFVLPSLFEGVPVSIIEAASSGIKYVISENIDSHLNKNDLELKLCLSDGAKVWAKEIYDFAKKYNRKNEKQLIENSGFDIEVESKKIAKIYQEILHYERNKNEKNK